MHTLIEKAWTFLADRFTGRNAKSFTVHRSIMTIPNMVTISGILWTIIYTVQYSFGIATGLIPFLVVLIVLTDAADGYLADRLNQHSSYGRVLDPVRDRLFTAALLGNLWIIAGKAVLVPIGLLVLSEVLLALEAMVLYHISGEMPVVHWIGKARSALQWVLGYAVLFQTYWLGQVIVSPVILTYVMAFASIAAYIYYSTYYFARHRKL